MLKIVLSMIMMSMMFMTANHPLSMAIILMMLTLLISLLTGTLNLTFWYSYMLFMIMIGGMLVLVIYMTTLASNETMESLPKYMILFSLSILVLMMPESPMLYPINNTLEITPFMSQFKNLSLSKYITSAHLAIFIMIINYLYITLIAIVKITNLKYGSLRQKF